MSRRLLGSLLVLGTGTALLLAAGLADPAGSARLSGNATKGGTLRVLGDIDFVDPALAYLPLSWSIEYATCAKLFNYPDKPGAASTRLVPEVVDRFTVSKDGLAYTFVLKQTFRFHTGARVTAQSFADAFNRNARLRSPATQYMHEIVGADAVIERKARSITGIRVLARHRLQIRLEKPLGDLTARLTMPFFCPILPGTPVDPAGIDDPAGSGPYYVAERIVNQRVVLERNPFYRGNRPANVDRIVVTIAGSAEDALRAVAKDRADVFGFLQYETPRSLLEKYVANRSGGRLFVSPVLGTLFFAFNHDRPAFDGPGQIALKKAINLAVDRPALAHPQGYLDGQRTNLLLPPPLAHPAGTYPLDGPRLGAARAWFARARLKPTQLVLYAHGTPPVVAQAQVLAHNLRQLGVRVDVKYFDFEALAARLNRPGEPFDLAYGGYLVDYADGAGFFVQVLASAGTNLTDAGVRRRVEAANRLTGEARRRAWADLDVDLMRDNPPWVPFMNLQNRTFVSKSVGCFLEHPIYGVNLAAVCKK